MCVPRLAPQPKLADSGHRLYRRSPTAYNYNRSRREGSQGGGGGTAAPEAEAASMPERKPLVTARSKAAGPCKPHCGTCTSAGLRPCTSDVPPASQKPRSVGRTAVRDQAFPPPKRGQRRHTSRQDSSQSVVPLNPVAAAGAHEGVVAESVRDPVA